MSAGGGASSATQTYRRLMSVIQRWPNDPSKGEWRNAKTALQQSYVVLV